MLDEVDGREKWQIDRELGGGKIVRPVRSFFGKVDAVFFLYDHLEVVSVPPFPVSKSGL